MADYKLQGGSLEVSGSLDGEDETAFRDRLAALLTSRDRVVIIDLTAVKSISSVCVGAIVSLWIDLCAASRGIKVLMSDEVSAVFRMAGLFELFSGEQQV